MAGMFKWAAYGYRGEARAWPRVFSRSGIIEANGDWKENSWFYRSMWRKDRFTKIYPEHWNLKGKEQEYTEVRVYTSADEVEMWLNGRLIGMRKVNPYRRTIFFVPYEPGELRAIAKKDGKIHSEDAIFTTQAAYRLRLKANKDEIKANRRDVVTVTATAEDEKGRQVLWEERQIRFLVDGDVTVLAVQNSDPYEHRAPKDLSRKLYHGSCQLVIRANGVPGNCLISAVSEGLESASLTLEVVRAQIEPHVDTELFTDSLVYFAKMSGQN
jgi:beta-galactosidase